MHENLDNVHILSILINCDLDLWRLTEQEDKEGI